MKQLKEQKELQQDHACSQGRGVGDAVSKALQYLGVQLRMRQPNSSLNPFGRCDGVTFQACLWLSGEAKLSEVLIKSTITLDKCNIRSFECRSQGELDTP